MKNLLPFVARLDAEEANLWITELQLAMPQEHIVAFDQLTPSERHSATVAIVANPNPIDLDALPALKWVQSLWAGVERILGEVKNESFTVVRLQDPQLASTMAEAVLAWTLYLHRDMPTYAAQQAAKVWKQLPMRLASDCCVAILGTGLLGQEASKVLRAAGFRVLGWSRANAISLPQVLSEADIVVCLLPLTPDTRGLLNAQRFAQMKPGASIINFGRGAIVNTKDLVAALTLGTLKHAVLDVFEQEPLERNSALWLHPQVTVLPHISAPTHFGSAASVVAHNIRSFRSIGRIPLGVDRSRGY